jgi:hypothetical protein
MAELRDQDGEGAADGSAPDDRDVGVKGHVRDPVRMTGLTSKA